MNDLEKFYATHEGRFTSKWQHYLEIYDRHLSPFRSQPITLIEFGVNHGGSLEMWREYLGPEARIIGVDINPDCASFSDPENKVEVLIGDQSDERFLQSILSRYPEIHIVIDDGGHTMQQQITTFEALFPAMLEGGLYVCEDLHTSYWPQYGGGLNRPGTFIEKMKDCIDSMHHFHLRTPSAIDTDWSRQIGGMHLYDSIVILEKSRPKIPREAATGRDKLPGPFHLDRRFFHRFIPFAKTCVKKWLRLKKSPAE